MPEEHPVKLKKKERKVLHTHNLSSFYETFKVQEAFELS